MEENNNNATQNSTSPMHSNQVGSEQQPASPPNATPPQAPAPTPEPSDKGPITGIVVIVILLIFAGIYFWGTTLNKQAQLDENTIYDTSVNDDIANQNDEPAILESELDAFDVAGFDAQLDADLEAIEGAL